MTPEEKKILDHIMKRRLPAWMIYVVPALVFWPLITCVLPCCLAIKIAAIASLVIAPVIAFFAID
jgi:hypothetical protein